MLCIEGGSAGRKIALTNHDVCFGNKLCCFSSYGIDAKFLYYYLQSPLFRQIFQSNKTGIIGGVSITKIRKILMPVPPLKEQKRIVNELEKLIPFVEQYDNLKEKLDKLNTEFPNKFKESILQEAIQGNLVPQDSEDEPANILLEKIQKEKEQLIKEKKIKRNNKESFIYRKNNHYYEKIGKKGEPKCIDEELPFNIPYSWEWCRLNSLGEIIGGGTPKTKVKEYWDNGKVPWITPADMKFIKGKYVSKGSRNINELGLEKSSAKLMPKDSIIFSSRAPIGYIAITKNELCTNQGFKSVNLLDKSLVDYLYYCLQALTKDIQSRASGTTFKEISGTKFGQTLIPLPPLEEQKRIVETLDKLLDNVNVIAPLMINE